MFKIVKVQLSELAYKHNTNQLPSSCFNAIAIPNYETCSRKTNKILSLPGVYLNYGQIDVEYAVVKTWNETKKEMRASMSIKTFRNK